jgi:hypothetical protein
MGLGAGIGDSKKKNSIRATGIYNPRLLVPSLISIPIGLSWPIKKKKYFKLDFTVFVIIPNVCVIRRHSSQHSSGCRLLVNFSIPPLY